MAKEAQKIRSPLLLLMLGIGLVLLALAVVFLLPGNDGTPAIVVEPAQIDFGKVAYGADQTIEITVRNSGDAPLRFTAAPSIEVLEGC